MRRPRPGTAMGRARESSNETRRCDITEKGPPLGSNLTYCWNTCTFRILYHSPKKHFLQIGDWLICEPQSDKEQPSLGEITVAWECGPGAPWWKSWWPGEGFPTLGLSFVIFVRSEMNWGPQESSLVRNQLRQWVAKNVERVECWVCARIVEENSPEQSSKS